MRPVNLIPPEERRGEQAPLRTGPLAYILLGALVLALAGVTALVLTGNQISDRKGEVAPSSAKTPRPRPGRNASPPTRNSARSRTAGRDCDQPRRQPLRLGAGDARTCPRSCPRRLARNLERRPRPVQRRRRGWLLGDQLARRCPGPALELSGCATGQDAVAGFVTALKDIDGVTRVGVESSELASEKEGAGSGASGGGDCRTRNSSPSSESSSPSTRRRCRPKKAKRRPLATETAETTSSESSEEVGRRSEG